MKKREKDKELVELIKRDLPRFFNIDFSDTNEISKLNMLSRYRNSHTTLYNDAERNHLIITLSKNRRLWKWIDKVYDIKKYEYYKCYKETFFSDTPLKEVYSTKTKEYINKLAGIDKWCRDNNTEEPLLKIIQKEHNKLYSRFKVGIKEFNLDIFLAKKLQEIEKQDKNTTRVCLEKHNQVEEIIIITMYLAAVYNVEISGFLWKKIMDTYMEELFSGIRTKMSGEEILNIINKKDISLLVDKILEVNYIKIKNCKSLDEFYDLIILEQTEKVRKTASIMCNAPLDVSSIDDISQKIIGNILSGEAPCIFDKELIANTILEETSNLIAGKVSHTGISHMVNLFFNSAKTIGLDKEVLMDIPINTNIIETALLVVTECKIEEYANNEKKIDNTLKLETLALITTMALLESYKSIKPHYFSQEEESQIVEIENLNKQLDEKDIEINRLKSRIENIEKSKNSQIKDLLDDLDLSKKKIKRLEKEVDDSQKDQQEFLAMKEYIYRNAMNEDEIALSMEIGELSIKEKINYINERKIAIFGGHPNWVNKLKKIIPDAMYIDTNACSSRRFNRLDRYDLLVICNLFISHGLSWKVSEAIKNVKSKKVVIIDDINTDLIINNMYDAIKLYEESENKLYKNVR